MERLIFATGNEGKMKEIRMILGDMDYEILSMKEAGIAADIVEDGKTFEENAEIKARAISKLANCLVLADDSGLEVDALGKEPGIYSARYEETAEKRINKLLFEMKNAVSDIKDGKGLQNMCDIMENIMEKLSNQARILRLLNMDLHFQ